MKAVAVARAKRPSLIVELILDVARNFDNGFGRIACGERWSRDSAVHEDRHGVTVPIADHHLGTLFPDCVEIGENEIDRPLRESNLSGEPLRFRVSHGARKVALLGAATEAPNGSYGARSRRRSPRDPTLNRYTSTNQGARSRRESVPA